jgi:hypothetical protein
MAGTFPGVSNTQQSDINGQPLVGGLVFVYNGGTTVLSNTYQDIGLAIPAANPLTLDQSGRCPLFFVADGTYRVRLTDYTGSTANGGFDQPQVPSIGQSSSGGGGTAVDPTTIFQVGDPIWLPVDTVRAGWVRMNGRTIGAASSGASERANADCQNLFLYIWQTFADAQCPVVGGRGTTALNDWNADKQITLVDMRGIAAIGMDTMGNTAAGRLTGALFTSGSSSTAYATGGEPSHTIILSESPSHTHGVTVSDPGHTHGYTWLSASGDSPVYGGWVSGPGGNKHSYTEIGYTGISLTQSPVGGDQPHNNMPPFATGTWFMKL